MIEEFLDEGVRTFLALRGDPPAGSPEWTPHPGGLTRASELVELLREVEAARCGSSASQALRGAAHKMSIAVAAFPTGHPGPESAAERRAQDLQSLLAKQEAGADFAITQVFFEPAAYLDLVRDARALGVTIPILAGVIPTTDPARLLRVEQLTGVTVPAELLGRLLAVDDDRRSGTASGCAASVDLANAVLDGGAPGLHVYTFNRHRAALDLLEGTGLCEGSGASAAQHVADGHAAQPRRHQPCRHQPRGRQPRRQQPRRAAADPSAAATSAAATPAAGSATSRSASHLWTGCHPALPPPLSLMTSNLREHHDHGRARTSALPDRERPGLPPDRAAPGAQARARGVLGRVACPPRTSRRPPRACAHAPGAASPSSASPTEVPAIPSAFSFYDQVLDAAVMAGALPDRFAHLAPAPGEPLSLEAYSTLARGSATELPLEMTKWFDTNYHYLVPEIGPATPLRFSDDRAVRELAEGSRRASSPDRSSSDR